MGPHRPAYAAAKASLNYGLPISGLIPNSTVIQEGWVLKKRRKKMQGFARRYFILYQSGLLSYSFEPGQPVRDQISLPHAAISTAPGRKDIHIDSNNATFHIKCLSSDDFTQWMAAFRKFIVSGPDARRSASIRLSSRQNTVKLSKSAAIIEEMSGTIAELEEAFTALRDTCIKKSPSLHRTKSDKDARTKEGASMFGLFKKAHHHHHHHGTNEFGAVESPRAGYFMHSDPSQNACYERVYLAIESLKAQHGILIKSLQSISTLDQSAHASPLPSTLEEEEHVEDQASDKFSLSPTKRSKRNSVATTATDSLSEWFDASEGEGAQEFILDDHTPDNGEQSGQPSRIVTNDSRSSLGEAEESSIDTDMEPEDKEETQVKVKVNSTDSVPSPARDASQAQIVRRTQLPAPIAGDEGSLFAVLKKNVGKDLSTIAFPVTFNEPLTLLQRAAEELEYYNLLDQAAATSDPAERIQFVAAFAVSSYAHTRHRTGRKGFNPMLAETFEDVRMKFIAEKVRHNPVEMAYHAEGADWELYATSAGKTKFWGKSLEIIPLGTTHLKIGNDHYQWKKPSSFMRNLMVGTKYLEHIGKMSIENVTGHNRCILEFKQSGYWGSSNVVSGTVYDTSGKVLSQLEGKWDEQFSHAVDSSHLVVLWRASPWPKHTHEYYGFTAFGMTLNEITPDIANKLPSTDSRRRTDVRALEEGDVDTAEAEKVRIEELQRERRRKGKEPKPRWFRQEGGEWVYVGGYWEARAKGWEGAKIEPLW